MDLNFTCCRQQPHVPGGGAATCGIVESPCAQRLGLHGALLTASPWALPLAGGWRPGVLSVGGRRPRVLRCWRSLRLWNASLLVVGDGCMSQAAVLLLVGGQRPGVLGVLGLGPGVFPRWMRGWAAALSLLVGRTKSTCARHWWLRCACLIANMWASPSVGGRRPSVHGIRDAVDFG